MCVCSFVSDGTGLVVIATQTCCSNFTFKLLVGINLWCTCYLFTCYSPILVQQTYGPINSRGEMKGFLVLLSKGADKHPFVYTSPTRVQPFIQSIIEGIIQSIICFQNEYMYCVIIIIRGSLVHMEFVGQLNYVFRCQQIEVNSTGKLYVFKSTNLSTH